MAEQWLHDVFASPGGWDLLVIAARTALLYLFVVIALRVTGKRQFGEMNTLDLLLIMVISNAVQNAMSQQSPHLSVALVSSATLILIAIVFRRLTSKFPMLEPLLLGEPTVLVENGRLISRELHGQGLTENDLMTAVRGQGIADLKGVRLAVLEVNGNISIVPREDAPAK
jgi:uncharacterized membrane protein YcaP (DUF421 family)